MKTWALQDAKAKFSEVVRRAIQEGAQEITLRGKDAVVVVAKKDYQQQQEKKPSFIEMMQSFPCPDIELDLERNKSTSRDIEL